MAAVLMLGGLKDAGAAIAVDTSASSNCTSCTSLTYPVTVGAAGTNRLLVVGVAVTINGSYVAPASPVASVTYAGQALTQIGTYLIAAVQRPADAQQARLDQWYLVDPPTGANNVVVTLANDNAATLLSGATSLTGASRFPIRGYATADAEQISDSSVTVNSAVNDLVLDTVCAGTSIQSANQTQQYKRNVTSHTACDNIGGSTAAGAATVNMSWVVNGGGNDIWSEFATSIKPAEAPNAIVGHLGGGKIGSGRIGKQ